MLIKCAIIDDEPLALDIIERHIKNIPFLELIAKYTHSVKAFEYLSENEIDLIFIDNGVFTSVQ